MLHALKQRYHKSPRNGSMAILLAEREGGEEERAKRLAVCSYVGGRQRCAPFSRVGARHAHLNKVTLVSWFIEVSSRFFFRQKKTLINSLLVLCAMADVFERFDVTEGRTL